MPNILLSLQQKIQQQWQTQGILSKVLGPLSRMTSYYATKRRQHYLLGKRPVYKAPIPVIVVGNIFVGGTGKTPLVIALVQALQTHGHHVGIISRGYGIRIGKEARFVDPQQISQKNQPLARFIGDEPSLLAEYAPIAVHPNRTKAVQALLQNRPDITVIISDDGLQHYALAREIEIVVQDTRRVGNGLTLPAGPLREPISRLKSADFIVTNYNHRSAIPSTLLEMLTTNKENPSLGTTDPLSVQHHPSVATSPQEGPRHHPRAVTMYLAPTLFEQLSTGKKLTLAEFLANHGSKTLYAIAGIGNPQRFYQTLNESGLSLKMTRDFPDHYQFKPHDLDTLGNTLILMTSKDATKCRLFAKDNHWAVHIQAHFYPTTFFEQIQQLLDSTPHRPTTIPIHRCCGHGNCG